MEFVEDEVPEEQKQEIKQAMKKEEDLPKVTIEGFVQLVYDARIKIES